MHEEPARRCKHCGYAIGGGDLPLHLEGPNAHLHRCAPTATRPYGYTACPEGAECGPLCYGDEEPRP